MTESLNPGDTRPIAKRKLDALRQGKSAAAQFLINLEQALLQPSKRGNILSLLDHIIDVMDFENNFLWYPEWYGGVPVIKLSELSEVNIGFSKQQQEE